MTGTERRWVAFDLPPSGGADRYSFGSAAKLTPEEVAFLAEAVSHEIEAWGDPEGDLHRLRRKLRGEEEPE